MKMPRQQRRTTRKRRPAPRRTNPYPLGGSGAYYRPKRIGGSGAYTVDNGVWANRGASLGGLVGRYYGGETGSKIGSWLGRRALHYPAKLFGSGDYTLESGGYERLAPEIPTFRKSDTDDSIILIHREYLGDIYTSSVAGAFKIESYGLNPSEINTFPWLSNIAQPNFQQYRFDGLVFEFRSFSANALNSTNTALGSVFACINYDYTDADLESRYEVENTDWSKACKPSDNMLIPVECKPKMSALGGMLYVINGNQVPAGTDPKTYYLGKLWIGTTGFQGANVNIGSLYVTYKIKLYKPVMTKPLSNALIASYARSGVNNTTAHMGTATIASAFNCDSIGLSFTGNVMTISKKRLVVGQCFMINLFVGGTSTASVSIPLIAFSAGLVGLGNIMNNIGTAYSAAAWAQPQTAVTETSITYSYLVYVTSNSADITMTVTSGTYPSPANMQVLMTQICGIPFQQIGIFTPTN